MTHTLLPEEDDNKDIKSPVASPANPFHEHKWFISALFLVVALVVAGFTYLRYKNNDESKTEEIEEPVRAAAQAESRHATEKFDLPAPAEQAPVQATAQINQTNIPAPANQLPPATDNQNLNPSASKEDKLRTRLQLEAAQRRLTSPVQAYEASNTAGKDSKTSTPITNLKDPDSHFANEVANQTLSTMQAHQQTSTDQKIFQGKVIPAVLDTAINSDLPGLIRATISEDVYGETGRSNLLPKGTRLIGQYNSEVKVGQVRVYVIWTRAITPDQVDIQLGSPGTDALGRAGFAGSVDNHFFEIFGTSILLSLMAAGAADINTPNDDTVWGNPYQYEVVEGFTDNSDRILERQLAIKPTITIDQGEPVRVMVAQDLDFTTLPITKGNIIYDPYK